MKIIYWLLSITVLISACKPKQNSTATPPATPSPSASQPTGDELQALNNMVISFYSIGEGVNAKAVQTIEDFIIEYSSKVNHKLPYSKISWGREGEVDFCISLAELKEEEKRFFVDKTREMLKPYDTVHFYENHKCRELK